MCQSYNLPDSFYIKNETSHLAFNGFTKTSMHDPLNFLPTLCTEPSANKLLDFLSSNKDSLIQHGRKKDNLTYCQRQLLC